MKSFERINGIGSLLAMVAMAAASRMRPLVQPGLDILGGSKPQRSPSISYKKSTLHKPYGSRQANRAARRAQGGPGIEQLASGQWAPRVKQEQLL